MTSQRPLAAAYHLAAIFIVIYLVYFCLPRAFGNLEHEFGHMTYIHYKHMCITYWLE